MGQVSSPETKNVKGRSEHPKTEGNHQENLMADLALSAKEQIKNQVESQPLCYAKSKKES